MTPKPYKVQAYEPGAANIIDRATHERVGYVLADFHGRWNGFRCQSESSAWCGLFKYRKAAAAAVWEMTP